MRSREMDYSTPQRFIYGSYCQALPKCALSKRQHESQFFWASRLEQASSYLLHVVSGIPQDASQILSLHRIEEPTLGSPFHGGSIYCCPGRGSSVCGGALLSQRPRSSFVHRPSATPNREVSTKLWATQALPAGESRLAVRRSVLARLDRETP